MVCFVPVQVIITGPTTFVTTADGSSGAGVAAAAAASAATALLHISRPAGGAVDLRRLQAALQNGVPSASRGAAAAGTGPGVGNASLSTSGGPVVSAPRHASASMPPPVSASTAAGVERSGSQVGRTSYQGSAASSVYGDLQGVGSNTGSVDGGWRRSYGSEGSDGGGGGGSGSQGRAAPPLGGVAGGGAPFTTSTHPQAQHSKPPAPPLRQAPSATADAPPGPGRHGQAHAYGYSGQRQRGNEGSGAGGGAAAGESRGSQQYGSRARGDVAHEVPGRFERDTPAARQPHAYGQQVQHRSLHLRQLQEEHTWAPSSRGPMDRGGGTGAPPTVAAARSSGGGAGGGAGWGPPHFIGAVDGRGSVISVIPLQAAAAAAGNGVSGAVEVTVRLVPPPHQQQQQYQQQQQQQYHQQQQQQYQNAAQSEGVYGGHLLPQGAGQWHGEAVDGGAAEHWARAAAEPRRGAASFSREPFRLGAVGEPWGNAVLEEQQLRAAAQAQVVSGATMDFTGKSGMAPAAAAQPAAPLEETLVWRAVSVLHHKRGTALVYLPPTCAPCR